MGGLLFTLGITHPSAFISFFPSSLSWICIPLITLPPSVTLQFTWPHPIPFFGGPFFFAPRVSPCFGSFILPPFSQSLSTCWFLLSLSPSFSSRIYELFVLKSTRVPRLGSGGVKSILAMAGFWELFVLPPLHNWTLMAWTGQVHQMPWMPMAIVIAIANS